ncbi:MAG: Mut7-C RNAse domain-containing protein [Halodesulfurarchaeum sp.]|nr:Mut7-C RNAse domain-containing protein [Halodesulfurarchaeum sp.]
MGPSRSNPEPTVTPAETRLCLDVMLGGLVSPLRMIGYDTAYALDRGIESDGTILELSARENRLLLTRNRAVASTSEESLLLTETAPLEQLRELDEAGFTLELTEPMRCSRCNGTLDRETDGPGPADGPDPGKEPVWECRNCGQFYWKGSHWEHLRERLERL